MVVFDDDGCLLSETQKSSGVTKATARGKLLPCDKVTGGCQSDIDRSEYPKKRKASENEQLQILNNKKTNSTTIEASPVAPQHVENDIHVKQNEHLDCPGSDDDVAVDVWLDKLSEKGLGMSAGDIHLMRLTCNCSGRHYGPMSVLYYIRCMLLCSFHEEGVNVVGIQMLLDKVKDGLKGLKDVDVKYYVMKDSKSTETSRNDDPAVEPAVDAEGSKKSMDDTKRAQSLDSTQPSGGALKFAQSIVAFCDLIPKKRFHLLFLEEIEFHDLVLGIIDDIITADDLACAHQLFEDEHAHIMLSNWSDDEE